MLLAGVFLAAGLLLKLTAANLSHILRVLRASGDFSNSGESAFSALDSGLLIAGSVLLVIAVIMSLAQSRTSRLQMVSTRTFLILICGWQLAIGWIAISQLPRDQFDMTDERWYLAQARNLAAGRELSWNHFNRSAENGEPTAFWPIGYPAVLSVLFRLFGDRMIVAQSFNLLAALGTTLMAYRLARSHFGEPAARATALVLAFMPSLTMYTVTILSESLLFLLLLSIIYLGLKPPTRWNTVGLGLLFGFALLTRPIILFLPLLLLAYRYWQTRHWRSVALQTVVIFALAEAVLLPWQIRNYQVFGSFIPFDTHGGWNYWQGNKPTATGIATPGEEFPRECYLLDRSGATNEATRDRLMFRKGLEWTLAHPAKALSLWPRKIIYFFYRDSKCVSWTVRGSYQSFPPAVLGALYLITDGYYYALGLAFFLAMIGLIRKKSIPPPVILFLGICLYLLLVYLPFITEARYHAPLLPLVAIMTVAAGDRVRSSPEENPSPP